MKTFLTKTGSLLLLMLLTFSARAYVLIQDNFNYANGNLTNVSDEIWSEGPGDSVGTAVTVANNAAFLSGGASVTSDYPRTYFTNGIATNVVGYVISAPQPVYFFPSNAPVAALYYSYTLTEGAAPSTTSSAYFSYLVDTNYDFRAKVLVTTTGAASGYYRLGVSSSASSTTNVVLQDLAVGQAYAVVVRYVLSTGISTLWVSPTAPASESDSAASEVAVSTGAVGLGGGTNASTAGFGLRNVSGIGPVSIANLLVGTTFGEVVPATVGSNPPFVVTQPQNDPSAIVGDTVSFTSLFGGDPFTNQWYYQSLSNPLPNQTNATLTLPGVLTTSSGAYFCVAGNAAGSLASRSAQLTVYASAVAPAISAEPQSQNLNVGDTATFSVTATGVPPPGYQWYYVTNSAGTLKTNGIAGATAATCLLNSISNNLSGNAYYVAVTNRAGTNISSLATLTVNPIQSVSIATLKSMVDDNFDPTNTTSIYTITGIVTTWTNMTGTANTEFYMQDASSGIDIFWDGANSTNRPPAGALVTVQAPISSYAGLFELEPVYSNPQTKVTVISTNNPLPAAQALPFDPNVTEAQLFLLQGVYCVASNINLTAGTVFGSGDNEFITNNNNLVLTDPLPGFSFTNAAGETFDIYLNYYTDIPGKPKPSGPVTMYGVLGYYGDDTGVAGYEFTPSRYADVISYLHITNYLSNLVRHGDLQTNTFSESVLPPGETLTTFASIGDAAGGIVTLTPLTDGLPADAYWSNVTNGLTGTAIFHFTPSTNDVGTNYVVSLVVASTSGTVYTQSWTVYVPTPDEQHMAITEFLANPTTNTSSPLFNPLGRPSDTQGILANDQYVEIASQATNSYDMQGGANGWDIDSGNPNSPLESFDASSDVYLNSSNAIVVYGGGGSGSPTLPSGVGSVPASAGSLSLPTTGQGVIDLRNGSGYLVDRVVYNAASLPTNSALSRFPTLNSAFVPQNYVSAYAATPGLQYNGGSWSLPTEAPAAITGVGISVTNKQAVLKFTANPARASTLWQASTLTGPFQVVNGEVFGGTAGVFSVTNLPATCQFYFITAQ